MEKSPKYYIITYGCQMNMYDSDLIGSVLENNGYVQAQNEEEADLIIVNTCSVREHAEKRAIGRIENLMKYKNYTIRKSALPVVWWKLTDPT